MNMEENHPIWGAFLWVVCVSYTISGLALPCAAKYEMLASPYEPVEGKYVADMSTSREHVYLVGKGYMGRTQTHRLIPTDIKQKRKLRKQYSDRHKFNIEANGYRLLERLVDDEPLDATFRMPTAEVDDRSLTITTEDVLGRNLAAVMKDERVSPELKERLAASYKEKLAYLEGIIRKEFSNATPSRTSQDNLPALSYGRFSGLPPLHQLSIRAQQIIVTFSPSNPFEFVLTLRDPY